MKKLLVGDTIGYLLAAFLFMEVNVLKYEFYTTEGEFFTEEYAVNMFKAVEAAVMGPFPESHEFYCKKEGPFPLVGGKREFGYTIFHSITPFRENQIAGVGVQFDGYSNTHQNVPIGENSGENRAFEDPDLVEISGFKQGVGDDWEESGFTIEWREITAGETLENEDSFYTDARNKAMRYGDEGA